MKSLEPNNSTKELMRKWWIFVVRTSHECDATNPISGAHHQRHGNDATQMPTKFRKAKTTFPHSIVRMHVVVLAAVSWQIEFLRVGACSFQPVEEFDVLKQIDNDIGGFANKTPDSLVLSKCIRREWMRGTLLFVRVIGCVKWASKHLHSKKLRIILCDSECWPLLGHWRYFSGIWCHSGVA